MHKINKTLAPSQAHMTSIFQPPKPAHCNGTFKLLTNENKTLKPQKRYRLNDFTNHNTKSGEKPLQRCYDKKNPNKSIENTFYACKRPAFGFLSLYHSSTIVMNQDGTTTSISLGNKRTETPMDYSECSTFTLPHSTGKKLIETLQTKKDAYGDPTPVEKTWSPTLPFKKKYHYMKKYVFDEGNCNDHQLKAYKEVGVSVPQGHFTDTNENILNNFQKKLDEHQTEEKPFGIHQDDPYI